MDLLLQAMLWARSLGEQSVGQDNVVLGGIDPNIRQVLDAAGNSGAHPAFLEQMLCQYGYDQSGVVRDLLGGVPLVGPIPVESSAKRFDVVMPNISDDELRCAASTLTAKT